MKVIPQDQVEFFHREGWLMVEGVFDDKADFDPLREEITGLLDDCVAKLIAEGTIFNAHSSLPFETRLTALVDDNPHLMQTFMSAIEGKEGGGLKGEAMFNVLTHSRLMDAVEDLVGPEVIGSSVYRVRPKLPGHNRGVVPWHQDSGYFMPHCDKSLIVTCWAPLVNATEENGCLQVIPRVHKSGVYRHHTGGNAGFLVITEDDLPKEAEAITVPVPVGGVLLMSNLTPHQSLWNSSGHIRWSVDLRYQSAEVPTNAFEDPSEFEGNQAEFTMACYPPEGDFVVRSVSKPEAVLTYEGFQQRRLRYDAAFHLPHPKRGWQPVGAG
jgi:phytanoyl-CoA hydroxylase